MGDCIFCKIVKGEIPTQIEKETENLLVFKDINPRVAVHLLIIPKKHVSDMTTLPDAAWAEIKRTATELAKSERLKGFRLVHNAGNAAVIPHMHVHFLGEVSAEREV